MYNPQDKYRFPGAGQQELVEEEPLQERLKKFAKPAAIIIVIAIVGYLVFDTFIGSNREVTISVKDTEGGLISKHGTKEQITVIQSGATKALYSNVNSSMLLQLKRDPTYLLKVADSKGIFESYENPAWKVGGETETITLKKRLSTRIQGVEFPSNLFVGQAASGRIELFNKGKKDEEIELIVEAASADDSKEGSAKTDIKALGITIEPSTVTVAASQTASVTINIKVSDDMAVSKQAQKKLKFRIKYLKGEKDAEETVSFTLSPKIVLKLSLSEINKSLTAGDPETKTKTTIEIENKSLQAVESIHMEVELDDPSADPDWFKFNPPDKNFDLGLKDYSKKQISLSLVTPMNLPAVILTGRLKFYYYNFEPKVIRFTYDIKAASVVLETKLSKNNFGVKAESCSPDGSCIYEKVIENYISLFNKGKKDLLNIKIGTLVACRDLWILFPEITYLESLPAGQKEAEKVPFVVTAPPTAKDEEYQRCVINIEYTDPDGGTNTIAEGLYIRAKR